jgi:hypothetical protein
LIAAQLFQRFLSIPLNAAFFHVMSSKLSVERLAAWMRACAFAFAVYRQFARIPAELPQGGKRNDA